ncbi:MAG: hypothetical protein MHM6MM_006350 [Cercozoa sp. M6MM]
MSSDPRADLAAAQAALDEQREALQDARTKARKAATAAIAAYNSLQYVSNEAKDVVVLSKAIDKYNRSGPLEDIKSAMTLAQILLIAGKKAKELDLQIAKLHAARKQCISQYNEMLTAPASSPIVQQMKEALDSTAEPQLTIEEAQAATQQLVDVTEEAKAMAPSVASFDKAKRDAVDTFNDSMEKRHGDAHKALRQAIEKYRGGGATEPQTVSQFDAAARELQEAIEAVKNDGSVAGIPDSEYSRTTRTEHQERLTPLARAYLAGETMPETEDEQKEHARVMRHVLRGEFACPNCKSRGEGGNFCSRCGLKLEGQHPAMAS